MNVIKEICFLMIQVVCFGMVAMTVFYLSFNNGEISMKNIIMSIFYLFCLFFGFFFLYLLIYYRRMKRKTKIQTKEQNMEWTKPKQNKDMNTVNNDGKPNREKIIKKEDVENLVIALNTAKSFDDFLNMV
jgi:Ca2+/Na+ antiporter